MTLPSSDIRLISDQLGTLRRDVDNIFQALRSGQLGHSSIEGTNVPIFDADGILRGSIGIQDDGTFATVAQNAPEPPPIPSIPNLSAIASGIKVGWDGTFQNGVAKTHDFMMVKVYRFSTATPTGPSPDTFIGTLYDADEWPDTGLASGNTYWYGFTAVNTSGQESALSLLASEQPDMVVAQDVLDGIISDVKLAADAVAAANIKLGAVGTAQLANQAVDLSKLADGSVDATKLIDSAVTGPKIGPGAVTTPKIAALSITAPLIGADAVTAPAILASSVEADKIAANAITAGKIAADAVTANSIAANAVTTSELAANSVVAGKVAADAITANEIAANAVTTTELNAGSVTTAKMVAGAIGANEIAANAVIAGKVAASAITANELAASSVIAGKIATNAVQATNIVSGAVTAEKIAALAITADKVSANAINAGHIQSGSVTAAKLEADMVITKRVIAGSPTGARSEMHPTLGFQTYNSGGTRTFWADGSTGSLTMLGTYRSAATGQNRVEILQDGTLDFYQGNTLVGRVEDVSGGLVFRGAGAGATATTSRLFLTSGYAQMSFGNNAGSQPGSFRVDGAGTQAWGRIVGFRYMSGYAGDGTQPRCFFNGTNTNGSDDGASNLHLVKRTTHENEPTFIATGKNSGLVFDDNSLTVTTGNPAVFGPISASAFNVNSSEFVKQDITDIALLQQRTSWDLVEGCPTREFGYIDEVLAEGIEDVSRDQVTGDPLLFRKRAPGLSDVEFAALDDEDERKWVWETHSVPPAPPARRHRFPIAEDLAALAPDLVAPGEQVDLRDIIGILWDATDMLIKRNRLLEQILLDRFPSLPIPGRPQKGDVREGVGAIIPGRTRRQLNPQTGQIIGRIIAALGNQ